MKINMTGIKNWIVANQYQIKELALIFAGAALIGAASTYTEKLGALEMLKYINDKDPELFDKICEVCE